MRQTRSQVCQSERQRSGHLRQTDHQQAITIQHPVVQVENRLLPAGITRGMLQIVKTDHIMTVQARQGVRAERQQLDNADADGGFSHLLGLMADRLQQMTFAGIGIATDHHYRKPRRLPAHQLQPLCGRTVTVTVKVVEAGIVPELDPQYHL